MYFAPAEVRTITQQGDDVVIASRSRARSPRKRFYPTEACERSRTVR